MEKLLNGFNDGLHPSSGIGGKPGAFDENGDAITRGYVAPGLDKEAIAKEYLGNSYDELSSQNLCIKKGIEYAENHYLKIIEEKDKKITQLCEELLDKQFYNNDLEKLHKELQQAKELLKEIKFHVYRGENDDMFNKIEEFLNK